MFPLFWLFCLIAFSQKSNSEIALSWSLKAIECTKSKEYPLKLPNQLACLTNIYPKKVDLNYVGVCYQPTKEELQIWKDWVIKNQTFLSIKNHTNNEQFNFIFIEELITFNDQ